MLANLVEQIQLSGSVDILQTVLNVRHRRPQIVPCLVIARLSCTLNIHVNVMMQSDVNIYHIHQKYFIIVILINCFLEADST